MLLLNLGSPVTRVHGEERSWGWAMLTLGGTCHPTVAASCLATEWGRASSSPRLAPTGPYLPPGPEHVPAGSLRLTQRLPACASRDASPGAGISRLAGLAGSGPAGCCWHQPVCVRARACGCVCVHACAQLACLCVCVGVLGGWCGYL